MAISDLAPPRGLLHSANARAQVSAFQLTLEGVLAFLASLRLTVFLFALSIFLVFAGTLAQVDNDVWEVVRHTYFRTWVAHVQFQAFERLGQMFYKPFSLGLPAGAYFPFPGGKLIGIALLINLLAAHAIRFKVVAKGSRLLIGLAVIALGLLMTYLVIRSGSGSAIESELSPQFAYGMWLAVRGVIALAALAFCYYLIRAYDQMPRARWNVLLAADLVLIAGAAWLLFDPFGWFDYAGMRIVWQLLKGTNPGLILLAGCFLLFKRRAGIVLLHGGVALMMFSEILTAIGAHESQMTIPEGSSVNWSQDIRTSELAVIDHASKDTDHVAVIPQSMLTKNIGRSARIESSELPFDIQVLSWIPNSKLADVKQGDSNPATAGAGLHTKPEALDASTGVDMESKADLPSAYVELFSKDTNKSLGTYLVSQWLKDQPVKVGDREFDLSLRFERQYYPFALTLKDFEFKRYVGTNTAKSYESLVQLKNPEDNVDREIKIWMNNPLRYSGMTFYQSSFDPETETTTILQVVKNPGWMAPYVGCMFVLIGMVAHFGTMLVRFLERQFSDSQNSTAYAAVARAPQGTSLTGKSRKSLVNDRSANATWLSSSTVVPAVVLLFFGGYLLSKARIPKAGPTEMQIFSFGELPVQYQGRVKPYDSLARNTLQYLSAKQELIREDADGTTHKEPAIRWLLDTISSAPAANDNRVFRIDNPEVLDTLGLKPRPGSFRYSINELRPKIAELEKQWRLALVVPEKKRSLYQRRIGELFEKVNLYAMLQQTFGLPQIGGGSQEEVMKEVQLVRAEIQRLRDAKMPLAVPPTTADVHWTGLMESGFATMLNQATKQPVNEGTVQLYSLLNAYAKGDTAEFNRQLTNFHRTIHKYESTIAAEAPGLRAAGTKQSEILSQSRIRFETFFNSFSPFFYCAFLYLVAFVLGAISWLGWSVPLRRASIWLLWFTFAVHTFALASRLYISGRPPVTNLYSSAVFIGWAAVLLALVLEWIFKLGLGSMVAAIVGFLTLVVAHFLSLDGDTLIVMQAVLDTQFWLATHVVCITLGYATTFVAGAFGIVYLLLAHVVPILDDDDRKELTRMIYGTLCFAILFSFIGTVLGGLWADDSWGRFWGWDPKENGALIIVLWNALVLHARWGGMVKGRGLATLVVGGNIVTTWSWFGVNELGVGLHSYGASESSTAMWLLAFAASQLAIIALGLMPANWFTSEPTTKLAA